MWCAPRCGIACRLLESTSCCSNNAILRGQALEKYPTHNEESVISILTPRALELSRVTRLIQLAHPRTLGQISELK
eukprot:scaffold1542_cov251-Chaetoceros_neogracile.AAC.6